ncbi:radical SAM protein [candidate division KSB1 bacterium]
MAFSVSFENDYFGLVEILDRSGIPVMAEERRGGGWPVVVVGGIAPTLNPEPLAEIVDIFLLGEAEEIFPAFLDAFADNFGKRSRGRKEAALENLDTAVSGSPGVYIPRTVATRYDSDGHFDGFETKPEFQPPSAADVNRSPTESRIVSPLAHFRGLFLTEVARGCPHRCRFCIVASDERNYRIRNTQLLLESVDRGLRIAGAVGLVGSAVLSHPGIIKMMELVAAAGGRLGLSSVRLNAVTSELAQWLAACRLKSVTAAPEAASFHLRKLIGKPMTDDTVLGGLEVLSRTGVGRIKLYFMVGFPGESDKDAAAVPGLVANIRRLLPPGVKLNISVSPFVPKPGTPLRRAAMADRAILKSRLGLIRSGLAALDGVEMGTVSIREAMIEGLLSRGDRRLGRWLEHMVRSGGNRFRSLPDFGVDPGWLNAPWEEGRPLPGELTAPVLSANP